MSRNTSRAVWDRRLRGIPVCHLRPRRVLVSRQIFHDLAAHVHFDGLLFQDDAYLTDEEDMNPAALSRFQARHGVSASPAELAAGQAHQGTGGI